MLKKLRVSNLAVVEKAEADFVPGLNVLTGETGAGKSVLMGALELVLGGHATAGIVRDGASEAEVEAEFGETGVENRCRCREEDQNTIVIRRTVTATGRSRAWINDESVSLGELKAFCEGRVDIHGPRSNQKILEEGFQRDTLDSYVGNGGSWKGKTTSVRQQDLGTGLGSEKTTSVRQQDLGTGLGSGKTTSVRQQEGGVRGAYRAAYAKYADVKHEYETLAAKSISEDELDLLRYQVNEIESANLTDEDDTIAERHAAAAHAAEIVESASAITEALGGDDGAAEKLARLQPLFHSAAKHFPAAADWSQTAEELTVGIQELSRTVADAVARVEASGEDLDALDARLTLVSKLKRKYGDNPLAKLSEKKARLAEMDGREERLAKLAEAKSKCEVEVKEAGAKLTEARKKAADQIAKRVTKELVDLGFKQAKFSIALEPIAPEPHGCDRVVYLFEPNPGEAARPLADIASSGETARVMLAIKEVLAEHDATELLVFDEIDANIGGEIGAIVGAKMRSVAKTHQVIAITHLPQSAAFGERHLVVAKSVSGGRTRTRISSVEGDARVKEIARMLGGEQITSVVRKHAEELLGLSH